MLGRFHELSLLTADIAGSWERWLSLRFAAGEAGDVWKHPYGVVACEGLSVGLHASGEEPVCVTFVRPDVAGLEKKLSNRLIGVDRAQLGAEEFNLLELREPGGVLLRIQEARSFSPPADQPVATALGCFRALSLPSLDLAEARSFWERLDIEVQEIDDPWEGLAVSGLPLACHDGAVLDEPVLLFDLVADNLDDEALREAMLGSARTVPALRGRRHRLMRTPERLAVLLLGPLL
jgi:hypothetical protein